MQGMIVGITGTNGSGKGELATYLVSKGFVHLSVRSFLEKEIKARNVSHDRDSVRIIANELRQMYGPTYIIASLLNEAHLAGTDVVIESVRCPAEAELFKNVGLYLLAVDADVEVRYGRISARGSATDYVSREKFNAQEKAEAEGVEPWDLRIPQCVAQAHFTFHNNRSLDTLHVNIDTWLASVENNFGM